MMGKMVGSMVVACSVALVLVFILFAPIDAFGMGTRPKRPEGIERRRTGPVSAPEPGIVTLIGMAVAGGAGYFLGKRKK